MKKLLFLTAFPPNNKSGGQVFSLNLLKDLSKTYIIDLIYFTYKDHVVDENIHINSIKPFDVSNLNSLRAFTDHPIFTRRFNKDILQYLTNIAPKYDVIFFDYTQVGFYSLYLNHPNKVIRCHDVMAQKFSRKDRFFKNWVKLTEKRILKSVQKIFVLTEKDADILKKEYNFNALYTHEYIKDFFFYDFVETNKTFVFFGLWSRPENLEGLIWFIKNVLPFFKHDLGINFLIIGGGLSEKIRKKYLLPHKTIEYLGFVDNPFDIIYRSSALIAPLFTGAGVKVKVIDAFTTGTPVIGTDITFEGLPFIEDLTFLVNKPEEYAKVINNFPLLRVDMKRSNAETFRLLYDNHHLLDQL
jgi:hypothetical protein